MCFMRKAAAGTNPLAQMDSQRANAQATIEARLRRRKAGAAADVLTGPLGIPGATTRMGQAA